MECIKQEATHVCEFGRYPSFVCFLGISSVINRNINSLYPYNQDIKSSKLLNVSSNPRNSSTMTAICIPLDILWKRCGYGEANLTVMHVQIILFRYF